MPNSMFSSGDTVICINNDGFVDVLTLYKNYTIIHSDTTTKIVFIKENRNTSVAYCASRFILLKDYRLQKLKEIYNV